MKLINPYVGPDGVLTGSARLAQEAQERAATLVQRQEVARRQRAFDARHAAWSVRSPR